MVRRLGPRDEGDRMMLITPSYLQTQVDAHTDPEYGVASKLYAPFVSKLVNQLEIAELLDYGAGKCRLFKHLQADHALTLQAYDPAIPSLAGRPLPSQMVCCLDVLEHIEPECLDEVLDDLQALTLEIGFYSIATTPAVRTLSDGRNAHLIQEPASWWLPKLLARWDLQVFQKVQHGFFVVVSANEHIEFRRTSDRNYQLDAA
jgi:hypothetical protein